MGVPAKVADALGEAITTLRDIAADFALVGGLAVGSRAEPRFTRDVDLAVAVRSDSEAEAIVGELLRRGWQVAAVLEQTKTNRLATVRLLGPTNPSVVVDALFASSGIEPEVVAASAPITVLGRYQVRVASTGHLLAMKVLSRNAKRRQDDQDIDSLIAVATNEDLKQAVEALGLMQSRGFSRKKHLLADFERILRAFK